jgi:hypothetical protein
MTKINKKTGKKIIYSPYPQVCRIEGCQAPLRRDNRKGVCQDHRSKSKTCARCLKRCNAAAKICNACRRKDQLNGSETVQFCWENGCQKRVRSKTGYCREHWKQGPQCEAHFRSTGLRCTTILSRFVKYPYCARHWSSSRKFWATD